ncbi:MAG: HD-GYP domain-containing protein [Peptococcaceae bacterium]|nr:HD-GYP domain-containing protein [Peptococcaceae bacterium]
MNINTTPLAIDALSLGRPTDYDLYDNQGRLLLAKGQYVSQIIYDRLLQREIYTLSHSKSVQIQPRRFTPIIYNEVLGSMQHLYYEAAMVDSAQLANTMELVDVLIKELEANPRASLEFKLLRTYDNDLYIHSVNVSILAGMIGIELGLSQEQVKTLTLGALIHDIGKLAIPKEILHKPGGLTNEEFHIMKQHPEKGVEMLTNVSVPSGVLNMVRHHHERWNGTGYPYGLKGNQNALDSQIVAVADVFDAVTADRPYRKGIPFYQSYELVTTNEGLSPTVLGAFKKCVVFYPEHSLVTLNTGEVGRVITVPMNYPTRPSVRVVLDAYGRSVEQEVVIDLMSDLTTFISDVSFDV